MSGRRNRLLALGATGLSAVAAAVATGVVVERRVVRKRHAGGDDADEFQSLSSSPVTVTADDGVVLHAEVDEVAPYATGRTSDPDGITVVFVHGYALDLDCWYFQRQYFRGKRRLVFYDQRSHGRSGQSSNQNATIDQLGRDLLSVLDHVVPDGKVILVGHSMGGMAIVALAEQHPGLFGDRVIGVALVSTTAGGMRTHKILSPIIPERLAGTITPRVMAALAKAPELVDSARRRGSNIGYLVADRFAFGDDVPASYVEFVDRMLSRTSFEVLAQFFPNFDTLDKFSVLQALDKTPTLIMCGDRDLLTAIGHSRKMAARMPHARLVEMSGAGHMVILERHTEVNAALAEMFVRTAGEVR